MAPSAWSPIPTMPALTPILGMLMVIGPVGRVVDLSHTTPNCPRPAASFFAMTYRPVYQRRR